MRATCGLGMRFGGAMLAVLLAGAFAAEAADVGGGYWPVIGRGKVTVARSGLAPVKFESNLRLDFDGAPGDASGTGHLFVYDPDGQILMHQVPFTWTAGKGKSILLEPSGPELGEYIVQRVGEATGFSAIITLQGVAMKCTLKKAGEEATLSLRADGEIAMEGGPSRKFRANLRAK